MEKPWPIRFSILVTNVHDGDTISGPITADAGLGVAVTFTGWRVRFFGINAPELSTEAGKAALAFLDTLVKAGDTLTLDSYSFDNYGQRIDAVPYTADGTNLSEAMLDSGNAVKYP